jgi:hypothetical protein
VGVQQLGFVAVAHALAQAAQPHGSRAQRRVGPDGFVVAGEGLGDVSAGFLSEAALERALGQPAHE